VVAVGAGAAGGGGAEVFAAAVGAGDQAGEVGVAGGDGAFGVGVGAGFCDVASLGEGVSVDQRFGGGGDGDVSVGGVPGVGWVVEDAGDGVAGPGFAAAVAYAASVEFVGDGAGADAFLGVEPKNVS